MPKDILQNSLETMSAMISAAGTKVQTELLGSLKENMEALLVSEEDSNAEEFTEVMQKILSILEDSEFDLEFIKSEIRAIKLSLSEMTTKMLKASVKKTRKILEENKVEEEVEEAEETEDKSEDIKVEPKEEAKETGAAEEAVKEENKIKEEEENTMAKTIEELKEKLRKAKEAAAKCDSSTLAKVGKVGLGLAIVAGAAYGGYYYANNYSGRNTTIIINGGDED
jgi:D-Tyr-tRNAtyr deacylase